MRIAIGIAGLLLASFALPAAAQEVLIADGVSQVSFTVNGRNFKIARDQDQKAILTGEFAKTSRPCPAFCVQPMIAATCEGIGAYFVFGKCCCCGQRLANRRSLT